MQEMLKFHNELKAESEARQKAQQTMSDWVSFFLGCLMTYILCHV